MAAAKSGQNRCHQLVRVITNRGFQN
jgi:hypothetical protein